MPTKTRTVKHVRDTVTGQYTDKDPKKHPATTVVERDKIKKK